MKNDDFAETYFSKRKNWLGQEVGMDNPVFKKLTNRKMDKAYSFYKKNNGGNQALVVGCGYGFEVEFLIKKGWKITGFDISPDAVETCKQRYEGKFFVHDVEKPIEGKYDLIVASEVLEHLPNPGKAIENMNSCLLDSGYLIASTPNRQSVYNFFNKKFDPTHISIKSSKEWRSLLINLQDVKIKPMQWIPGPWWLLEMPGGNTLIIICKK